MAEHFHIQGKTSGLMFVHPHKFETRDEAMMTIAHLINDRLMNPNTKVEVISCTSEGDGRYRGKKR